GAGGRGHGSERRLDRDEPRPSEAPRGGGLPPAAAPLPLHGRSGAAGPARRRPPAAAAAAAAGSADHPRPPRSPAAAATAATPARHDDDDDEHDASPRAVRREGQGSQAHPLREL